MANHLIQELQIKEIQSLTCQLPIFLGKFIFQLIISIGHKIVKTQVDTNSTIRTKTKTLLKKVKHRSNTTEKLQHTHMGPTVQ